MSPTSHKLLYYPLTLQLIVCELIYSPCLRLIFHWSMLSTWHRAGLPLSLRYWGMLSTWNIAGLPISLRYLKTFAYPGIYGKRCYKTHFIALFSLFTFLGGKSWSKVHNFRQQGSCHPSIVFSSVTAPSEKINLKIKLAFPLWEPLSILNYFTPALSNVQTKNPIFPQVEEGGE